MQTDLDDWTTTFLLSSLSDVNEHPWGSVNPSLSLSPPSQPFNPNFGEGLMTVSK